MKVFAAIDVGSYELGMKIFEISSGNGLREVDHIRHRIDLGTDTFATGKISYAVSYTHLTLPTIYSM